VAALGRKANAAVDAVAMVVVTPMTKMVNKQSTC